jgi:MFS family permease
VPFPINAAVPTQTLSLAHPAPSAPTMPGTAAALATEASGIESGYAWFRLAVAMLMSTIGGVGMWSVIVALPAIQSEFGVDRGTASIPYTMTMIGFGIGGIFMGRASDRFGVMVPIIGGTLVLGLGYILAAFVTSLWQFAAICGVLIGMLGSSATFAPIIADVSQWFTRNRGMAMAIAACGNYASAAIWPPIVQYLIATHGWRQTHIIIGVVCLVTMLPLALVFRRRPPVQETAGADAGSAGRLAGLGLSPGTLMTLLMIAGVACCVAMSMPQVHIVA